MGRKWTNRGLTGAMSDAFARALAIELRREWAADREAREAREKHNRARHLERVRRMAGQP